MANYANLLATIAANIYTNGNQEVTAAMVKSAINALVASLGAGYQFMGVAHPSDTPSGYADLRAFWLASEAGTYTNFGALVLADGEVAVIKYDGNGFSKEVTGAATAAQVAELVQYIIHARINVGYTITTNVDIGAVVNTTPNSNDSWAYVIAPVTQGQKVKIWGVGGNGARLWAFTDESYRLLSKSTANVGSGSNGQEFTAPNDGYLIFNGMLNNTPYPAVDIYAKTSLGEIMESITDLETEIDDIETSLNELELNRLVFIQGSVNTVDGYDNENANYIHTDYIVLDKETTLTCPSDFMIRGYATYNNSRIFQQYTFINGPSCTVQRGVYKFVVRRPQDNIPIEPSEFVLDNALITLEDSSLVFPPVASFSFETTLLDVEDELQGIDMSATDNLGCKTFQDQIYSKFDSLITQYPDRIQKFDLGEFVNVAYPAYANLNGAASGSYRATPTYRTYMYKISFPTTLANVGRTATKRTIFVVAGLHGWENGSQLNTYVVASKICECANNDWYSLLSAYDIYFVPCLNGYGAYHELRVNANDVDLNRNFPYYNWAVSGEGTINYSGPSAASEFETKILCKAVETIKPDIFIDHHSYGPTSWTFYVNPNSEAERVLSYINLHDWTYRACKDYPQYYGSKFETHPAGFWWGDNQSANVWARNLGVNRGATVEVCLGIGYVNGVAIPLEQALATYYQEPIVKLNELMLRLFLLRFADFQLKNDESTGELDDRLVV